MDWQPLGTLLVGALGALGAAGWLVGRDTRRIARLKGEAELWKLLDDGDAKTRLREHLEASVLEYVKDQGAISHWWAVGFVTSWWVAALLCPIGVVFAVGSEDHEAPVWWGPAVAAAAGVAVFCAVRMSLHQAGFVRKFRQALRGRS